MHPSFGIDYRCPSFAWGDLMKGPPREAVLAHTFKVLNYRALFGLRGDASGGTAGSKADQAVASTTAANRYATAA